MTDLTELPGWREADGVLHTRYRTGDFATGLRLVNEIGAAAEAADHHPDLDLRYGHVDIHLWSHDVGAVTARDVRLARRISEIAADLGIPLDANNPADSPDTVPDVTPDSRKGEVT